MPFVFSVKLFFFFLEKRFPNFQIEKLYVLYDKDSSILPKKKKKDYD